MYIFETLCLYKAHHMIFLGTLSYAFTISKKTIYRHLLSTHLNWSCMGTYDRKFIYMDELSFLMLQPFELIEKLEPSGDIVVNCFR
jgi:hypothetical protein